LIVRRSRGISLDWGDFNMAGTQEKRKEDGREEARRNLSLRC